MPTVFDLAIRDADNALIDSRVHSDDLARHDAEERRLLAMWEAVRTSEPEREHLIARLREINAREDAWHAADRASKAAVALAFGAINGARAETRQVAR